MSRYKDLDAVKAAIEENETRLKNCLHHEFFKPESEGPYSFTYTCKNCGGRVDQIAARYYVIGYAHGQEKNKQEAEKAAQRC